jgi:hypothetical protein
MENKKNQMKEKIISILKSALLAPSTSNTQPWLFKLSDHSCQLYFDSRYSLKEADPKDVYFFMSLGCCLENMIIAAQYYGIYKEVKIYNPKEGAPIAEVFFSEEDVCTKPDYDLDKLYKAISIRKTMRGTFQSDVVSKEQIDNYIKLNTSPNVNICLVSEKEPIQKLASLTAKGVREAYDAKSFRSEMADYINHALSKKRIGMPTYSLKIPWFFSFFVSFGMRYFNLSPVLAKLNYKTLNSAPLHCVVSVLSDDVQNWLEAGRIAQRIMLAMQADGLQTSIAIASVFKEKSASQVKALLEIDYLPIFLFGAGKMNGTQPVTRKSLLEEKLIG